MATWLQVAVLAVACAASARAGGDACLEPSGGRMECAGRGLAQPPSGLWPGVASLLLNDDAVACLHPNAFTGFPDLYLIFLQNNRLAHVDLSVFAPARPLVYLYLDGNAISSLTASPGARLEALTYLYLTNNRISALDPDVFTVAPNLLYVFLDANPLLFPEDKPFLNHPTLELVQVTGGGALGRAHAQSFVGLPQLKDVLLDSSGVSSVDGAFASNALLRTLSLSGNFIVELKAGSLPASRSLIGLWLQSNPLTSLEVEAVQEAMAPYSTISIADTPLACGCGYEELQRWAQENHVSLLAECSTGAANCAF